MHERLINIVGQSLVAIGLYTVAFESLVLTFRAQMQGYLLRNDPSAVKEFHNACKTADLTFKYCESRLIQLGVLDQEEVKALASMRKRRNAMAHEGYNHVLSLTVRDVEEDVRLMFRISSKLEAWRQVVIGPNADGSRPFYLAPAIFGMYLQIAEELARTTLRVEDPCEQSTPKET